MLPPAVLWADPGGMTGLAMYHSGYLPQYRFMCEELPQFEACEAVEFQCMKWGPSLSIGWERFTIGQKTAKMTRGGVNTAIEVIGVCKYMARKYGCQVLPEASQHSPEPSEQLLLKRLDWWRPGKDDAQSAACHLVRWMLRTGNAPPAVHAAMQDQGKGQGNG